MLAGCSNASVLQPEGPIAAANRTILVNSLAIMLLIVVPTIVASLVFAWWFRASNARARYRPDFVYSGRIELIVWSIPILVILFLGGLIWVGSHDLDPRRPVAGNGRTLEVQVVSLDWKWLFIYPEQGVASVNRLVLPVGRPVRFRITSASVMNVFFVPKLGSMIYAMNGMETEVNLRADRAGSYYGQSAQYSGDGFSDMDFTVDAVPPAQFAAWATTTRAAGPVLDRANYARLARQFTVERPFTFSAVQPNLFRQVSTQAIPPAPGPEEGRSGPEVSPRNGDTSPQAPRQPAGRES